MGCKIPMRYSIMAMVFFSTYINYCTRTNMSMSLPAMVKYKKKLIPECTKNEQTEPPPTDNSTDSDEGSKTSTQEDTGERYEWTESEQGAILGAYFYGFMAGSLPAGAISEWFGPRWTIMVATGVAGILNSVGVFITPLHWSALLVIRVLIGFTGALVYPALQTLIGRWAPPQEKNKFTACLMGNTLGTALTWIIVGAVTSAWKWPWGFHVVSIECFLFLFVFFFLAWDSPEQCKWITDEELEYIKTSQEGKVSKSKAVAPYCAMMKSIPFWALAILLFGNLWGLYLQINAGPKFMAEYIGFNIKSSGFMASLPHLCRLFSGIFFGYMGDWLKRKKFKRVYILKSFILTSHILPGILMGMMILAKCNKVIAIALLVFSMSINGSAVVTHLANPTDLAPNFAGSIFAAISFIGGTTGFINPAVTSALIDCYGNNTKAWGYVFMIGAIFYCGSGVLFIIFGSADIQKWNEKKEPKPEEGPSGT
ncbi:unnamed protein product [Ceutorhynchus assimilis]|uniref:Major facilitator superfamily (MFS) profile domain-containing protein n=1 Tax=Ceutorhynchus assimilis TaxID=467358 RepID=A0A9N9MPI0_9CUCU|nr:unnamed protein product [Ceutorhynchus assimilis]